MNRKQKRVGHGLLAAIAMFASATSMVAQASDFVPPSVSVPPTGVMAASAGREAAMTPVGGTLTEDLIWSASMDTLIVTSPVIVPASRMLILLAGAQVKVAKGAGIMARDGGAIYIVGAANRPVTIAPLAEGELWQELGADNANSSIVIKYADISGGRTVVRDGAAGLFEDSYFHDYRPVFCAMFDCPIMLSSFASLMVVRRCHFREYYETLFRDGLIMIEDSLFEYMSGDGLDFDGAQPGSVVRRCTFRHGTRALLNIDAIDIGPGQLGACRDVVIEDCLMFDFPTDKGVSIGDAPYPAVGIVVRNCLIYDCRVGVQVKDDSWAEVYHCTIADSEWGFNTYNKSNPTGTTGGGRIINAHSNILWANEVAVSMLNAGTLTSDHSNFGTVSWPGTANLNVDPLFVNAALEDYRLSPASPSRAAGRNGEDMGAIFPVGAPMAPSHPRFESVRVADGETVLRFWVDPKQTYTIQSSSVASGVAWNKVADVPSPPRPTLVEIRRPMSPDAKNFYRIMASPRE